MKRVLLIIVVFISFFSCSKVECMDGDLVLYLKNFSKDEIKLLQITEYEEGDGFGKVKRVIYIGTSVVNTNSDSIAGNMLLNPLSYYKVMVLATNESFMLSNIQIMQSKYRHDPFGGEVDACIDAYNYKVNNTNVSIGMKRENYLPNTISLPIEIDGSKIYL